LVKDHHHLKCPLVEAMNKARERLGYNKILAVDGVWVRQDTKMAVDLSKEMEAVVKRVGSLETRVTKLEAPPAKGKKRKGEEAAPAAEASSSTAPPKKKSKKAKKAAKEKAPEPAAQAKGNGKAKAKSK
jgi:hypothetical protein